MIAKPTSRNSRVVTRALRCVTAALLGAVISAGSARAQAAAEIRPVLNATALDGELALNGLMDEPVWALADSIPALTQTEPVQGAAPTGQTAVKVLVTGDALVIGIRADDPEPARIVSYARSRDAGLENEDHVKLVLDTFGDGRSGYRVQPQPRGSTRPLALRIESAAGQAAVRDALLIGRRRPRWSERTRCASS